MSGKHISLTALLFLTFAAPASLYAAQTQKAANAFPIKLYQTLAKDNPENVFFSPYSLSSALAMLYGGAGGQTAEEFSGVLGFDKWLPTELGNAKDMLFTLKSLSNVELRIANDVWAYKEFKIRPDYQARLQRYFSARLNSADFRAAPEGTRKMINRSVSRTTRGLIRELIAPGMLDPATLLMLTNAVYFKGLWADKFKKADTQETDFTCADGTVDKVPMMYQFKERLYWGNEELSVVGLPYKGGELDMLIILPDKKDGLPAVEHKLSAADINDWYDKLSPYQVKLYLPRFKFSASFQLAKKLEAMGLKSVFTNAADFSGITNAKPFFLSEVLHQAVVEVNEEGTEAAAATATGMCMALPPQNRSEPVVFRADHPFIFLIRHRPSGQILFMGRVNKA